MLRSFARLIQTVQPKHCDFHRANFFQEFLVGLGRGMGDTRVSLSLSSRHTCLFIGISASTYRQEVGTACSPAPAEVKQGRELTQEWELVCIWLPESSEACWA